ncbi:hypothetical protein FQN60_010135, partial [Etheostoma spectabile]
MWWQVVPDSDAHRAGLQEGDQVLSVNEVDFQDIEHSRAVEILKTAREILMRVRFFPYSKSCSTKSYQKQDDNFYVMKIELPTAEGEDCTLGGSKERVGQL